MLHPHFGASIDPNGFLRELLEKAPKLNSYDRELVLRERYETTYGIYNHDDMRQDRPFAVTALHPMEDTTHQSLLHERVRSFAKAKIAKHFGESLSSFLALPSDVCLYLLEVGHELEREEGKTAAAVMGQMETAQKGKS